MDRALIDRIARSVLYEGYVLYPYRTSSLKNAKRWMFGTLYPESWTAAQRGSDRSGFQAEVLFTGPATARVEVLGRYLSGEVEREVALDTTVTQPRLQSFTNGELTFAATQIAAGLYKLTVTLRNTSNTEASDMEAAQRHALASAHAVISVSAGELVSVTDPPAELAEAASQCVNKGVWPVLIGAPGAHDTMLASRIILPDYPEVAPESTGDLCDATEIEEILTLRILTLTDEEKAEVRASEERARHILERAESLPVEHLMKLHGTIRGLAPAAGEPWSAWDNWANAAVVQSIRVEGAELKAGDRVRLRPGKRADIFDTALDGRVAVIAGIEQDFENRVHVAVVIEDDPGRDLGEMRQTGHRFFFSPEEMELP
jgi:hypothetical protein